MKLPPNLPNDGKVHTYCINCQQESPKRLSSGKYRCQSCRAVRDLALIIDPAINWWTDDDEKFGYWHEVAGIFVRNHKGEYLFFERIKYPFGLTIPAGHVDVRDHTPTRTALRELREETGIDDLRLYELGMTDVKGDQCRRGANAHRWYSYKVLLPAGRIVTISKDEGKNPIWLTVEQALRRRDLTFATRYILRRYRKDLR